MEKRKISAKEILADIKAGFSHYKIMEKYSLDEKRLQQVFHKLVEAGYVTQAEIEEKLEVDYAEIGPKIVGKCPACGKTLSGEVYKCPHCQVIISEFKNRQSGGHPERKTTMTTVMEEKLLPSAKQVLNDLQEMNFADEIIPIDASNITTLYKDFAFWGISCLGILPLMIGSLSNKNSQLLGFALFFALVWGFLLKKLVIGEGVGWKLPLLSFFFTGLIGIPLLLMVHRVFPSLAMELDSYSDRLFSLLGFITKVGFIEEACKILPVAVFIYWKKRKQREIDPSEIVAIGIFSGLGFAAFENAAYAEAFGRYLGATESMIGIMMRSLSLVFCHAIWSGIFSYFIATASATRSRWGALGLVGLGLSAFLHGVYDWFAGLQQTLAALTVGVSFMLFYGYMYKFNMLISTRRITAV
jgi:RsiW-degrading membrane proteinase PrsW (M82 family)